MILVFMLLLRESQECIPFLKNKQPPNPLLLHWLLLPCQNDFFSSHVLQHVWDDSCSAWHSDWMVSGEGRAWALFERWDVLKQFIIYWFWVLFLLQGALVKTDEQEVINFLLTTEIIPLCLRIMESGSELSKTVPFFCSNKDTLLFISDWPDSQCPAELASLLLQMLGQAWVEILPPQKPNRPRPEAIWLAWH